MTDAASAPAADQPDPRRWIALLTLLLAAFINLIDVTIVNVALPSLQDELGASASQIEWVVAGYVMAFALGLLPFGRLGDIVGRRRMFLIGVGSFTVMSMAAGMAPNIELLVAARILQGLSAAMMSPQVLALTQNIFPPHERGTAFSMFGLTVSIAAVTGPIVGGALITADLWGLGWRPIFLINLPIGVFAIGAGLRLIPHVPGNARLRNDWIGIALAVIALTCIVLPLIEGRPLGWPVWIVGMLIAALPAGAIFVMWQRHREAIGRSQLLPVSLMRNRDYVVGIAATIMFFSGIPGFFLIFALFLQTGFGFSPLESGLATVPFPAGIFAASLASGRMGQKWLKPRLILGTLFMATGMFWVRLTILDVAGSVDRLAFVAPLATAGIGLGLTVAVLFQTILANVRDEDTGSGSGALQAFQQVGGALGVALIGGIFFTVLEGSAATGADYVAAAATAMIYNVVATIGVMILSLFITPPQPVGRPRPETEPPAAVE